MRHPASLRRLKREPDVAGVIAWRRAADGGVEIAIVHRRRRGDWTLPKGHIDPGEPASQAARRELREEAGIDVRISAFAGILRYCGRGGGCHRRAFIWLAEATGGGFTPTREIDAIAWLAPDQAAARLQPAEAEFVRSLAGRLHALVAGPAPCAPGVA